MITVNLAKRLLKIGPIMVRIYTHPKPVSRAKLAPVLVPYGITSLRKSERKKPSVYFGTCESYNAHDKLIKQAKKNPIIIGKIFCFLYTLSLSYLYTLITCLKGWAGQIGRRSI